MLSAPGGNEIGGLGEKPKRGNRERALGGGAIRG